MGRTVTPRYAVEFVVDRGFWTPMGWDGKHAGRPTAANLAKFAKGYEAATMPGGVNDHLGPTRILRATILRNDGSRTVVATYAR